MNVPLLSAACVHVWTGLVAGLARELPAPEACLSADEILRAGRFHFERDRYRFVLARAMLRSILGAYLRCPADQIEFMYGPRGKPRLAEPLHPLNLNFNLGHSADLVVVAVTLEQELGIDVERLAPLRDLDLILQRFFSPREQSEFARIAPDQKIEAFYNGWTRKEAFIKALGDGLAYPLSQFDVTLAPALPARLLRVGDDPAEPFHWTLQAFRPGAEYVGALAIRRSAIDLQYFQYPRVTCDE